MFGADNSPSEPLVRLGELAEVSVLRTSLQTDAKAVATQQFLEEDESVILDWTPVVLPEERKCMILVTSSRIVIVGRGEGGHSPGSDEMDAVIDAEAVQLHAMAEEPQFSVYLQVCNDDDETPIDFTIQPESSSSKEETCQTLFDALTEMVSQHPIDPNEISDSIPDMGGMMMLTDKGPAMVGVDDEYPSGSANDDMIISPPVVGAGNAEATPEERLAALDRLDSLLAVPPEYEISDDDPRAQDGQFEDVSEDGQFDDAETDDGIL